MAKTIETVKTAAKADAKTTSGRPLRADARRNRDLILSSARTAFRERGPDASLEEIARNAGVGIGTLYRHFPTRNDLLDEMFRDSVDLMCTRTLELSESEAPEAAFIGWLHAALEHAMTYQSLAAALMISDLGAGPCNKADAEQSACGRLRVMAEEQVDAARAAHVIRDDVTADDIVRLVNAIALTTEDASDGDAVAERLFGLMVDGLRAP